MGAALAASSTRAHFGVGQAAVLAAGKGRLPLDVTVRQQPDQDEPRYMVTIDEGNLAGLRLWATEDELATRRLGSQKDRP